MEEHLTQKRLVTFGKAHEQQRINAPYIERERAWQNDACKGPIRSKLAEFFVRHHAEREQVRLLSTPGMHWQFEHGLMVEAGPQRECKFVGLEWTWGVIELGQAFMPGDRKRFFDLALKIGNISALYSAIPGTKIRRQATWLWCGAADFLTITSREKGPRKKRLQFAKTYKQNTCMWLDFTSQLCSHTEKALSRAQNFFASDKEVCPVAFTVLAARDAYSSNDSRTTRIANLLNTNEYRTFTVTETLSYIHHDIPMLTVIGLSKLCGKKPLDLDLEVG